MFNHRATLTLAVLGLTLAAGPAFAADSTLFSGLDTLLQNVITALSADSDGSRPPIPSDVGQSFRFEAGHRSELKPATPVRSAVGFPRVSIRASVFSERRRGVMPARRELTMRQLRQMLRLTDDGVSAREIGRTLGVARSTVQDNLRRAGGRAGLAAAGGVTDALLEQRLFARAGVKPGVRRRQRAGLGVAGSRAEAAGRQSDGALGGIPRGSSGRVRLLALLRSVSRVRAPALAGDAPASCGRRQGVRRLLGQEGAIVDPDTGEVREAEIFVAVLGASNYTYAEATWTQTLPDWIGAHVRMFRFLGGVPRLVVPDNLKSGVHKASFYDPEINRTYGMMAAHYGVGILPARPRKPRDKAKVEAGVRFAQTYILGRLRQQTFFSLAECNAAIATVLERINDHVMRRLGLSRRSSSRPSSGRRCDPCRRDYEFAEWRLARVNLDYHVEVAGFFYSVPHALIREQVDLPPHRPHRRDLPPRPARRRSRAPLWRPPARHRSRPHAQRPPALRRMDARALPALGPLDRPGDRGARHRRAGQRSHPEQGFRTCLGVLRLFRGLDPARAEAVAPGRSRSARSPTRASPPSSSPPASRPRAR